MVQFVSDNIYNFEKIESLSGAPDSLLIVEIIDMPEIPGVERGHIARIVEIVKSCIPKFKEFLNQASKAKRDILDECKTSYYNVSHRYMFKSYFDEVFEAIVIYWIVDDENINHVDIDKTAIPTLTRFIDENF